MKTFGGVSAQEGGVGEGLRLLVSCVPMREQKSMRKGTFFRAGQSSSTFLVNGDA